MKITVEIAERRQPTPFRLRRASFKGTGLQAGARSLTWHQLRGLAHERWS